MSLSMRALPVILATPVVFALATSTLPGCGGDAPALEFANAWVRAPVAGRTVTAAYCDISNNSTEPVVITGFTSETPGLRVEIHETTEDDGMMRMRPLRRLGIAPGETVSLSPGGKHLMMFGFKATTQARLQATLAGGGTHPVVFSVRPKAAR